MDIQSQLKVGQYAEFCKCNGQSFSSWIEAKILDIEWKNGRAQFSISFIDENGKNRNSVIEEDYTKDIALVENGPSIRPRPPIMVYHVSEIGGNEVHPLVKDSWQAGDMVEVRYGSYWIPGRVVEISCIKEKMIYFYDGSSIKVDSSMEIRAQVNWIGKSWFLVNNDTPQMHGESKFMKKFKPYVGEGLLSPNREMVTEFVRDIFTEHPSFARAIQKKSLRRNGKMSFPVMFMTNYLSGSQGTVTFEDSDGHFWVVDWTAYMQSGRRLVFTTGWPEFASDHNAKEGDVLLVEILNAKHFRVQILTTESGMCCRGNDVHISKKEVTSNINNISDLGTKDFQPSAHLHVLKKQYGTIDGILTKREEKLPCFRHPSGGRQFVASFCQSSKEKCLEYVLHGFGFCMLHILEDPSAPYKQCDYIVLSSGLRCRFPVSLHVADMRFCQIHRQMGIPNSRFECATDEENHGCGKMSLLVLAATVAHHHVEHFDSSQLWEPMKTILTVDTCGTSSLPEVLVSPPLNLPSINVVQPKQLLQVCEYTPSNGQSGKDLPIRKNSSHCSSVIVQDGLDVSESSNTSESIRGNNNGTGKCFTESGYQHGPNSSPFKDFIGEHVNQRTIGTGQCDTIKHKNDVECTSRGLCMEGLSFEKDLFERANPCLNATSSSPRNTLKEGTCQVYEKSVRILCTAPCFGPSATRRYSWFHGMPPLVEVGPIDLMRVGLMWTPARLLQCGGKDSLAKCPNQLSTPIVDLGEMDLTTMGLKCPVREPKRSVGILKKQRQWLDTKELIPKGHGRHVSFSHFTGTRRPYSSDTQTLEGKRLWLGTCSTENAASHLYNDAAHIIRCEEAVTNVSQGSEVDSVIQRSRSLGEHANMFKAPKRRRSMNSKKREKYQFLGNQRAAKKFQNPASVLKRPPLPLDTECPSIYGDNASSHHLDMHNKNSILCRSSPVSEVDEQFIISDDVDMGTARDQHSQEFHSTKDEESKLVDSCKRVYDKKQKLKKSIDLNNSSLSVSLPENILGREKTADSYHGGSCQKQQLRPISTAVAEIPDIDHSPEYSSGTDKPNDNEFEQEYDHSNLAVGGIDPGENCLDQIGQDKAMTNSDSNFSSPEQSGYLAKVENESHFYGVRKMSSGRFEASLYDRKRKKKVYVGMYDSMIEAARARDWKAIELGAASVLNFPELLEQTDLENENSMLGSTSQINLSKIQSALNQHTDKTEKHSTLNLEQKVRGQTENIQKLPTAKRSKLSVHSDLINKKVSSLHEPKVVTSEEQKSTLLQTEEAEVKDANICSLALICNSLESGKNGRDLDNTLAIKGKKKRKSISEYVDISFSKTSKMKNGQKLSHFGNHCSHVPRRGLVSGFDSDHIIESDYARVYKTTSKRRAMQSRRGLDQVNVNENEKLATEKEIIDKHNCNSEDGIISPVNQNENAKFHSLSNVAIGENDCSSHLNVHTFISDLEVAKAEDDICINNKLKSVQPISDVELERDKDHHVHCEKKGSLFAMLPNTKVKKFRSPRGSNLKDIHSPADYSMPDQNSPEEASPIIQQGTKRSVDCSQRSGKAGRSQKFRHPGAPKKSGFTKHMDYRGVYSNGKKFQSIYYDPVSKKHTYLGTFSTGEDAAKAYDQVAYEQAGISGKLNFCPNILESNDNRESNKETGMHCQLEHISGFQEVATSGSSLNEGFILEKNQVDYERESELVLENEPSTSDSDHDSSHLTKSNFRFTLDRKDILQNEANCPDGDSIPSLLKPEIRGCTPLRGMTLPLERGSKSTYSDTHNPNLDGINGFGGGPDSRVWGEPLKACKVLSFSEHTEPCVSGCETSPSLVDTARS